MAEAAVTYALENLGPLLQDEAKLLAGVGRELEDIKDELENMASFLRDADAKQEGNEGVKACVKQVRELAYDLEDCVKEFTSLQDPETRGCLGFLQAVIFFLQTLIPRHQFAKQIQDLKTRARAAREMSSRFQFATPIQGPCPSAPINARRDPRMAALYTDESDLVGIDKHREILGPWLLGGGSKLTVVSVVGAGGLGKTTLVRKVYESVKGSFQCHVWMTVSQSFETKELLKRMMRQLCISPEDAETVEELIEKLRGHLQNKRYVIVLDDIWNTNDWKLLKNSLPSNQLGSRVVVTTRIGHVASSCTETSGHVYQLQPLPPKEAFDLFCRKAFPSNPGNSCPVFLKELADIFLKKCDGLPLAIVTIGGLLAHKSQTLSDWQKLHDRLGSELGSDSASDDMKNMKEILNLSFNDLPYHLKSCFLYFSILPEDYHIKYMRLIRLWIAEGFVIRKAGMTVEEVAEDYLNELINRNMIQVTEKYPEGRIRYCQIHDLVQEILVLKSKEENFVTLFDKNGVVSSGKIRRLTIHDGGQNIPENTTFLHLRSLLSFGYYALADQLRPASFPSMRLLTVLDLERASLWEFPREIPELVHLKYLSLRYTWIKEVPNSLGSLRNLEMLDLRSTEIRELPVEVTKLQKLRHLLFSARFIYGSVMVPTGIGRLKELQCLRDMDAEKLGDGVIGELGQLTQLRKLSIRRLREDNGKEMCDSLDKMSCLRSLKILRFEHLNLSLISSPPLLLERLVLFGRLEELPHWFVALRNLFKLTLEESCLREDPFKALQTMPNLTLLQLNQAYIGEQLCSGKGGFPSLKFLELKRLEELKLVILEEGAMPCLEILSIENCGALEQVPSGIEYLMNLKEFHLLDVSYKCLHRLKRYREGDRSRVGNIPFIRYRKSTNEKVLQDLNEGYVEEEESY